MVFGPGDSGMGSASAERIKMVLAIINLGWDTSIGCVEFPINS